MLRENFEDIYPDVLDNRDKHPRFFVVPLLIDWIDCNHRSIFLVFHFDDVRKIMLTTLHSSWFYFYNPLNRLINSATPICSIE